MNLKIAVLSGDGIGPEVICRQKKLCMPSVVYNHEFVLKMHLLVLLIKLEAHQNKR
jgi:3-isopropylmalate dehydrogenase